MADWRAGVSALIVLGAVTACGSVPAPRQELGAAEQAVSQARAADAPQYAPAVFRRARNKLADAQDALAREEHARARRLAEEARVDAELAEAMAQSAKNKATVEEMRQTLESLRNQLSTSPAASPDGAARPVPGVRSR